MATTKTPTPFIVKNLRDIGATHMREGHTVIAQTIEHAIDRLEELEEIRLIANDLADLVRTASTPQSPMEAIGRLLDQLADLPALH